MSKSLIQLFVFTYFSFLIAVSLLNDFFFDDKPQFTSYYDRKYIMRANGP
jgi:ABC-type microcin C transport system permease subunit YejE